MDRNRKISAAEKLRWKLDPQVRSNTLADRFLTGDNGFRLLRMACFSTKQTRQRGLDFSNCVIILIFRE